MTHNFTTGHPCSWYILMWKESLCALLSTLKLTGILCYWQQQLSYWYLYWILSKQEQLLHQLIIWQVLIIVMPRVQHKPYKAFNDHCHFSTIIQYLFYYSFFYLLHSGFVPSFCIIVIVWFDAISLCSSKQNYSKINKQINAMQFWVR